MGTVPSRRGGRHGLVRSPSWILVIDKRAELFYSSRLGGWEPAGDGGGEDRGGGRPRPPRLPPGGDPRELAALARGPRCVLGPSSSFLPLYPAPADRLEFFPGALRRTVTAADPTAVPDAETPRAGLAVTSCRSTLQSCAERPPPFLWSPRWRRSTNAGVPWWSLYQVLTRPGTA